MQIGVLRVKIDPEHGAEGDSKLSSGSRGGSEAGTWGGAHCHLTCLRRKIREGPWAPCAPRPSIRHRNSTSYGNACTTSYERIVKTDPSRTTLARIFRFIDMVHE